MPAEQPGVDNRATTRPAVTGLHGLVAAGHPIDSSRACNLLKGGNALDATAAVSAMGCEPVAADAVHLRFAERNRLLQRFPVSAGMTDAHDWFEGVRPSLQRSPFTRGERRRHPRA